MTIFSTFRVDTRPYAGYEEPALPIGAWIGSGLTTGNATGGSVFMDFLFQIAEAQRVTQMYNLEQLAISIDNATTVIAALRTDQMDVLAPNVRATQVQQWNVQLISDGAAEASFLLREGSGLPIWLGAPTDGGVAAALQIELPNVDLQDYTATLQGYIWDTRSVIAPGGPQRPPFGIFGK